MSPAEASAFLRRYNDWCRSDDMHGLPYLDPRVLGKVIDAAVEMIDRLEATEKENAMRERVIDALGSVLNAVANERDELRTALEKIADWDSAWGPYPETNEAWRAMAIVTAREAVPRRGE